MNAPANILTPLQGALNAAALGLYVAPVAQNAKAPPLIIDWEAVATADPEQIAKWALAFPGCNWLIAPGRSGHMVLDLDRKNGKDGVAELERLAAEHDFVIPDTLAVVTPNNGFHLYLTGMSQSSAGRIAAGLDVRSKGGYVLAPGSVVDGAAYSVTHDIEPWDAIPNAPGKILALANEKRERAEKSSIAGAPVDAALLREALSFLDPDADYEAWRNIVAGIGSSNCLEAQQIAHEFSEGRLDRLGRYKATTPGKYKGPEPVDTVLVTMPTKAGGVGVGTIEKLAHDAGWKGTLAPRQPATEMFRDAIAALTSQPIASVEGQPNLFSTREQDRRRSPPQWLVEGLIQENTDVLLAAPSKFLKTFTAAEIAGAIASDKRVFGKLAVTRPSSVFYCAGEGAHSLLSQRITAWEIAHGDGPFSADGLHVAPAVPMLNSENAAQFLEDAKALLKPGERAGLFINDTLNRALNGADEDKSSTASSYFNMLAAIRTALGCSTLTVHHMGKNLDNGPRGSSAFYAGFDTVIVIDKAAKDEATGTYFLTVRVDKQKDGEDGQVFYLHARKVETPNGSSLALYPASADDLKRVAGKQVGLRRSDVAAALVALGACPDGVNAWTGETGGIPTKTLATEIARARLAAGDEQREPSAQEIDSLVTILNRGAQQGGQFDAYAVRWKPRQWAVAPGPISTGERHA